MLKKLRDPLIAFSLSNLCFIGAWRVLLNPGHYSYYYYWKVYPGFVELISLVIDVVILAALFWAAIAVVRRTGNPFLLKLARFCFLLALLIPLNDIRMQFKEAHLPIQLSGFLQSVVIIIGIVVMASLGLALIRWSRQLISVAVALVIIVSPFFLIALSQAAWLSLKAANAELYRDKPAAPLQAAKADSSPRILWILFDEFGYAEGFENRAEGFTLPEIDALRAQSLFATQALPPAMFTNRSVPSLLTSKMLDDAAPVNPNELLLELDGGEKAGWSTLPNVFSRAREAGFNTALVGWAHPYCRVIGDDVNSCFWESICFWDQTLQPVCPQKGMTILDGMMLWPQKILFRIPGASRFFTAPDILNVQRTHTESYLNLLAHSEEVLTNPAFNLTYLHLPVPHCPCIYNSAEGQLSSRVKNNYVDNLILTDRTLGGLRRRMESAGLWDETIVLVSSDHWLREENKTDRRIPFILKMPGQKTGISYDAPFNTVVSHELVLALLRGELKDAEGVAGWLDGHRSIVEGRY